MAKKNEELATEDKALVAAGSREVAQCGDFEEEAGQGSQFDISELQIPYISIIQSNSPQVTKGHKDYIKGLETGDIYHTVRKEVTSGEKGISVIQCGSMRRWVEWISRDSGGGFVA